VLFLLSDSDLIVNCFQIYSVKVKWGKETFSDVEANTDEEPVLFKAQLFALTGVQHERQKVMVKGVTLKDDDWGNIKLKDVSFLFILPSGLINYKCYVSFFKGCCLSFDGEQRRRCPERTKAEACICRRYE
jgi:hypothetical protein